MSLFFSSFFLVSGILYSLTQAAQARLPGALAPSTRRTYSVMFRTFLAFLAFCRVPSHQVNVDILIAFMTCLVTNKVKHAQLLNYISAIKTMSSAHSWQLPDLNHAKLHMYLKSIQKSSPFSVKLHHLIDIPLLTSIVQRCDSTYLGYVFKTCYLIAFFGFFRLSNLVPHSARDFSLLKHLTRGDVFFHKDFVIILIKWSKTMQTNDQAKLIRLPILNNSLCPAAALRHLLQHSPGSKNSPLFQFRCSQMWVPLTNNRVRAHLRNILSLLNLHTSFITFHSFRRSGASFAFNHNVSLQQIQKHGTWTSDGVWRYVSDSVDAGSQVATTFAAVLA